MAASELAVLGTVTLEEADIVADWSRPSFDVAASTVGVLDGDLLIGYAEVSDTGRGDAAVHPDHLGRGIGTALAGWMKATARAQGATEVSMPVPAGSPGESLLRALGYEARHESWVLALPEGAEIPAQPLPPGYLLRIAGSAELEPAYRVIEDAFGEWAGRPRHSYDDWLGRITGRPGYLPWNVQVVLDPDGAVVGAVNVDLGTSTGFVNQVAVRADQRGRGLAKALLAAAFASAREHGATRSELSTDSRTGALDLYLGLGMTVESTWINLGTEV
ncbi:GNAT family N-acetyltransferase [Nocardioides marmoriginsengisoli]|uniref:GNAT family N-acetyltransferase n=2 Tax=Nocardioides marmoriginsengisoli TaxID=661483 RepID=A0A3N0CQ95_9ACTN|nr:GNAT family N-acetyltransferase [Nocardioides marmoriginsengisoli]